MTRLLTCNEHNNVKSPGELFYVLKEYSASVKFLIKIFLNANSQYIDE